MFRIKICGITSVDDAQSVVRAGADAVGLNFYPQSPRCVTPEQARRIIDALPGDMVKVGLFVNAEVRHVLTTFDRLRLDLIQLHGDEPPEYLGGLGGRPVMRAFRVGRQGLGSVDEYLRRCDHLGCLPRLALFDAHVAGQYGGTGETTDWAALKEYADSAEIPPLVLAGGLTAANVADAIHHVHPVAVDTSSGVESSAGKKSAAAVAQFVDAARQALDRLGPCSDI